MSQAVAPPLEYERALAENARYADQFDRSSLPVPPGRRLAVLACMDARLTVEDVLGLRTGDAHIIRNAGGLATDDAIRSLVISQHLLGTEEIIVIEHTGCGMLTFSDRVHEFVRARNGQAHYSLCRDALYTLQPKIVTPDFDELCAFIRLRLRRRALLVFLTALDDHDDVHRVYVAMK